MIGWMILLQTVGGVRGLTSAIGEYLRSLSEKGGRRVLILGAGDAGELSIDDDPLETGDSILGLPIFGGRSSLKQIIDQQRIDEVLILTSSVEPKVLQDIVKDCSQAGIPSANIRYIATLTTKRFADKTFMAGAGNA